MGTEWTEGTEKSSTRRRRDTEIDLIGRDAIGRLAEPRRARRVGGPATGNSSTVANLVGARIPGRRSSHQPGSARRPIPALLTGHISSTSISPCLRVSVFEAFSVSSVPSVSYGRPAARDAVQDSPRYRVIATFMFSVSAVFSAGHSLRLRTSVFQE